MAVDWLTHVRKYATDADETVVRGIERYLGIALRNRDSSLVSFTDKAETDRVRNNFLKKKLALTDSDDVLDGAIAGVGERMKGDRTKNRVTVYYLLAEHFGKLGLFEAGAAKATAAKAPAKATAAKATPKAAAPKSAAKGKATAAAATGVAAAALAAKGNGTAAKSAPKKPTAPVEADPPKPAAAVPPPPAESASGTAAGGIAAGGLAAAGLASAASSAANDAPAARPAAAAAASPATGAATTASDTGYAGASATGGASRFADVPEDNGSAGGGSKWWLWLLLALLAIALFLGLKSCMSQPVVGNTSDETSFNTTTETTTTTDTTLDGNATAAVDGTAAPAPVGAAVIAGTRAGLPMLTVYFDTGKAAITNDFATVAAPIKTYVAANPGAKLAVSGFNDATGNAAANAVLSKNRAKAVQAALTAAGVPADAVVLEKPADSTAGGTNDAAARRVEVVVKQ